MATKPSPPLSRTVKVPHIADGWSFCWNITTQTMRSVTVKLFDGGKVYFHAVKSDPHIEGGWKALTPGKDAPVSFGAGVKGPLTLSFEFNGWERLKPLPGSEVIRDGNLVPKAAMFLLLVEDSTDNDYNDLSISISGWSMRAG